MTRHASDRPAEQTMGQHADAMRRALSMRAVRTIGAAYLASRATVLMAAWFAENLAPVRPVGAGQGGPLLQSLTRWDGNFFLSIARSGYHVEPVAGPYHDYVFFPLYPFLVRLLSLGSAEAAPVMAVAVSNVAFVAALGLLYLLGRPRLGSTGAARAAAILAIFPFATVFSMAYSDSVFLALTVAAFLTAERGSRGLSAVCLGLAALTRAQGVLLTLPLLLLFLRRDGWRLRPSSLWLASGPLAFLGYMAYVWALTGDSGAYAAAQTAWGHTGLTPGVPDVGTLPAIPPLAVLLFVIVAAYIFLLVYVRPDRLEPEYAALPVLFLLPLVPVGWLQSAPRYLMAAFPYAWILARRRNPLFRQTWPLVSGGLLGIFSLLVFSGALPP